MLRVGVGDRVKGIARYLDPKTGRTRFTRYETPFRLRWVRHAFRERWKVVERVATDAKGNPMTDPETGRPVMVKTRKRELMKMKAASFANVETGKAETRLLGRGFLAPTEAFKIEDPGRQP
jgi:hypothetical protein